MLHRHKYMTVTTMISYCKIHYNTWLATANELLKMITIYMMHLMQIIASITLFKTLPFRFDKILNFGGSHSYHRYIDDYARESEPTKCSFVSNFTLIYRLCYPKKKLQILLYFQIWQPAVISCSVIETNFNDMQNHKLSPIQRCQSNFHNYRPTDGLMPMLLAHN